jgi:DNA processing protein
MAQLLSMFGSASGVLEAPLAAFRGTGVLNPALADALRRLTPDDGDALERLAQSRNQQVLTPADAGYPPLLRSIPDPPLLLFAVGDVALASRPAVAIVGSRDHTAYGEAVAASMGRAAGLAGIAVVSGMARGLDATAQAAALDAGGTTIGVLGCGADIVYPRQNAPLYRRVIEQGLLLTESPPGEEPTPGAFPKRNRLISGLARALVVVEAADGSGTMITVATALEQGREVLAVPGPITAATSRGTNRLIRDGATPLLSTDELLKLYGAPTPAAPALAPQCTLSATEARVFGCIGPDPIQVDSIALAVGMPIGDLLGTLLGLEIGGMIEAAAGGRYRRK